MRLDTENHKDYISSITLLYKNVFQREPDNEGLTYWNDQLNTGLSFGDMLKQWGESEEFREKYIIIRRYTFFIFVSNSYELLTLYKIL